MIKVFKYYCTSVLEVQASIVYLSCLVRWVFCTSNPRNICGFRYFQDLKYKHTHRTWSTVSTTVLAYLKYTSTRLPVTDVLRGLSARLRRKPLALSTTLLKVL